MRRWNELLILFSLGASLAAADCSEHVQICRDLPLGAGAGSGSAAGNTAGSTAGSTAAAGSDALACRIATCQGKIYRCGDCLDNDADGLADSADPECTGPCDDTEDSYYGGIPGQNNAPCHEDCYFDQDTGPGNDHCYWSQDCDRLSVAPNYPPSANTRCAYNPAAKVPGTSSTCAQLETTQDPACLAYCGPLTPNGCDSFGCCELPAGSKKFVWIGSTEQNVGSCNAATLDDPAACHPCTPVASAFNACDECEVCIGRTAPLASCALGTEARCAHGLATCGQPGEPSCAPGGSCITGCCEPAPK